MGMRMGVCVCVCVCACARAGRADPPNDEWEGEQGHKYWNAHVDKANIATYDYSALLYLNTHGEDFTGAPYAAQTSATCLDARTRSI